MEIIPDNRSLNEKAKDSEWYAWILLFYLLISDYPNQRMWEKFSHDIVYKNRFSSSSNVLKEILNKADDVEYIVPKGTFFFRARKYEKSPYEELIREFLKKNNTPEDKIEKQLDQFRTVPDLFFHALFPSLYSVSKDFSLKTLHPIKTAFENWKNRQFKGFDADGSGAPSCDSIKAGRANPDFIRYLYLAEDSDTACYEMRPIIGQYISVATFRTTKDLKLYDLTRRFPAKFEDPKYEAPSLFDCISDHFSMPNADDPRKYIPTQFLTEKIKELGFDGIRFRSSLKENGVNVVVFQPESCEALSSDLIQIGKINIDIQPFDPCRPNKGTEETS